MRAEFLRLCLRRGLELDAVQLCHFLNGSARSEMVDVCRLVSDQPIDLESRMPAGGYLPVRPAVEEAQQIPDRSSVGGLRRRCQRSVGARPRARRLDADALSQNARNGGQSIEERRSQPGARPMLRKHPVVELICEFPGRGKPSPGSWPSPWRRSRQGVGIATGAGLPVPSRSTSSRLIGTPAVKQLVENHAQAVDVAPLVHLPAVAQGCSGLM